MIWSLAIQIAQASYSDAVDPFSPWLRMRMMSTDHAIGIVTALPVESAAVRLVADGLESAPARAGDPNLYRFATMPSTDAGRPHKVILALQPRDGTRGASAICASMAQSFPRLRAIVMCGIAGGVPAPNDPQAHVRLGDVVVATEGIVDYGHLRVVDGIRQLRRPVGGLSTRLLAADQELQVQEQLETSTWYGEVQAVRDLPPRFRRPPDETDVLTAGRLRVAHPRTSPGSPRVHRGLIGSADQLLRDEVVRDQLGAQYGIRAVEMEGSGIAVGAGLHDLSWFVIRGVADYCADATKNDVWHGYASWTAAAYVRALLSRCHPFTPNGRSPGKPGLESMRAIVDALCGLRVIQDDYQRRVVMATLPEPIRTAVPDSTVGRLHAVSLVDVCMNHPGGRDILRRTLELTLGPDSYDLRRVLEVFEEHWPS
jgi:nucleoside phosphorylase